MKNPMLIVNILAIVLSGFVLMIMGILMFVFKDSVTAFIKYLLPIPPISVAAYVFVFNLFKEHNGQLKIFF